MNNFCINIKNNQVVEQKIDLNHKNKIFYQDNEFLILGVGKFFNTNTDYIASRSFCKNFKSDINDIDGDFSFLIYNKRKKLVNIFRDKSGIKNIYYFIENEELHISSNVYDLIQKKPSKKFSTDGVIDFLFFEHLYDPITLFENVFSLERGTFVEINLNDFSKREYFFRRKLYEYDELYLDEKEAISKTYDVIVNAHRKRMSKSNAVLLSGGIDSTIMCLSLLDAGDNNLETISFDVPKAEKSDIKYSKIVAKNLSLNHHIVNVNYDIDFDIEEEVEKSNFPYMGSIILSRMLNGLKIDNSFNLFAGQDTRLITPPFHKMDLFYFKYMKSMSINKLIKYFMTTITSFIQPNSKFKKKAFSRFESMDFLENYIIKNILPYHPYSIQNHKNNDLIIENINQKSRLLFPGKKKDLRFIHNSFSELMMRSQNTDDISYMTNNIENSGFESSMPFFDFDIMEFGASLNFQSKSRTSIGVYGDSQKRKKVNKYFIRKAFEGRLPEEIIYRDKYVAQTGHLFLNNPNIKNYIDVNFQQPVLANSEVYQKLNLDLLYKFVLEKNGKWVLDDAVEVNEAFNLIFLDIIARKYNVT